jgi:hypothetical protein
MKYVIDYLGAEGVRTSPLTADRFRTPHPGDAVLLPDGTHGMVEGPGRPPWHAGKIHFCRCPAGAAWWLGQGNVPYVSISGGLFEHVLPERLAPTHTLHAQTLWNWGDHSSGAGMAVHYLVLRPVFQLLP